MAEEMQNEDRRGRRSLHANCPYPPPKKIVGDGPLDVPQKNAQCFSGRRGAGR